MNNTPTISVIIPVYGVEDYIEKCIQSLLDQTFTDFEAIIVDDGSLDQSIPKAKKLVGNDPRFVFLEKENGGQASARNMGLDYARGEYISFLDPDDYFRNDTFEVCFKAFNQNKDVDIILFGISLVDSTSNITNTPFPNIKKYYSENDFLLTKNSIDYSVCNKLFKKDTFKNTRFLEGIIYEDKAILPTLLYNQNLYVINEYLYFYQYRHGSTMNSYTEKSHKSLLSIYKFYSDFLNKIGILEENKAYYYRSYISYCFYNETIQILNYSDKFNHDLKKILKNVDPEIVNIKKIKEIFSCRSKEYISYRLIKISPYLFKHIYITFKYLKSILRK